MKAECVPVVSITSFDSARTTVGDLRIFSRIWASASGEAAPDAVLLHGLVVSGAYMEPLAQQLCQRYRVLVPDLPGFGESEDPERTLTISELAEALARWMDSMGAQDALMIGNSFGCQIITEFVLHHPGRARRLVFIGPTIDPRGRNPVSQGTRWLRTALDEPPGLVLTVVQDFFHAGLGRSIRTLRYLLRDRIERKLPKITSPLLVIRGDRDRVAPRRWAADIARLSPGTRVIEVPNAGHSPNFSNPDEVARAVFDFDGEQIAINVEGTR